MSTQKFQTAADVLLARLRSITTAGGFSTDAGLKVLDGPGPLDVKTGPGIVFVEQEESILQAAQDGTCNLRVPYIAEGQVLFDPDHPQAAGRVLARDIIRALFAGGQAFPEVQGKLEYAGRVIFPRESGSNVVVVQVKFQATFSVDLRA